MAPDTSTPTAVAVSSAPQSKSPSKGRLPLQGWALEFARRWNSEAYSVFLLQGNIYDVFPVQDGGAVHHVPLKTFLARRIFSDRSFLLFYDIGDGLTFASVAMQN